MAAAAMPSGKRPLVLNKATTDLWEQLRSDTGGWFPESSAGCSHFLLDGVQRPPHGSALHGRGPLHSGKLAVPLEQTEIFNKTVVAPASGNDCQLYVHEIATPIRPFFVDGDGKEPVTVALVTLMRDVVRAAEIHVGLEGSRLLAELKLPSVGEATCDIHPLMSLRPMTGDTHTWDDAFETALHPDLRTHAAGVDSPLLRLPEPLVLVFVTLFEIAVVKLMEPVLRSFYPGVDSDQTFRCNALCSYNHTTRRPAVARSDNGAVKFGFHAVYRWLRVDSETSLWLWQGLVDHFSTAFPAVPSGKSAPEWWGVFFDSSQFHSPVGGLRMPFCLKAAACKSCRPDTRRECSVCLGAGKFHDDRYYGPLCVFDHLNVAQNVLMRRLFHAPAYVVNITSLRLPAGTKLTKGLVLDGKREPTNMLARHRERLVQNVGKSNADRTIKKLAKSHRIDADSPRMCSLLEAVNSFDETVPGRCAPKPSLRIPLMDTDPRRQTVESAMRPMLHTYFHRACADVQVRSVTMVLDRPNGEPSHLVVTVRGPGGSRCFHREVDTSDSEIAEDLPPGLRGKKVDDVDGVPGRHTNSSNTVYYKIYRDGTVVQLCGNPQVKTTRRSAQKHGEGAMASCVNWSGETRRIERPKYDAAVRDMFYTPAEQQDKHRYHEEIVGNVAALSRRLKKAKKRSTGAMSLVGAFDTYTADVERAVAVHERAGGGRANTLTTEDVWVESESESSNSGFGGFSQ